MKKSRFINLSASVAPRALVGTVRADASDPKALVAALNTAFDEFKTKNDARLATLEAKGTEDVVSKTELDAINKTIGDLQAAIDEQAIKAAAYDMGAGRKPVDAEYTSAFRAHMTKGDVQASLSKGTAADGGYLTPVEWDRTISDKLIEVSAMRSIANVQQISGAGYKKLYNLHGAASGWVGETAARPETAGPQFAELAFNTGEIYANPAATQQLLDDAEIDLEAWLANEVELEFAYQEGIAFVSGSGVNKPNGILTYVTGGTNAAHPLGAIQAVATVDSAIGGLDKADDLIRLIGSMPTSLAAGARFVMNRNTISKLRFFKNADGDYMWQPSLQAGQPAQLLGYGVSEMAAMPDVAANTIPIMFGDFKRGYTVIDRKGTRVLRDPFTNKPYVHFYTTKRVGGGVTNTEVLKALKIRAA